MTLTAPVQAQADEIGRFMPGGCKPLMAMVEVTERCNMACPVCYADANQAGPDISLDKIRGFLEKLLELTGSPIPIQISGGEPSLRDDLGEIVDLARRLGYQHIELITNGIRIAREDGYLQALKARGLTAVYLQFDGLRPRTTRAIRGREMTGIRHEAVAAIERAGLCCTLAVAVVRGVNDDEIGDIVNFGFDHIDVVRAINFQSAARLGGRFDLDDQYRGYGLRELLSLIEAQTGIGANTFLSRHLAHPSCNAMSPVFLVDGRREAVFKYITEKDLSRFLGDNGREKILAAFAGKRDFFFRHLVDPNAWRMLAKAAPIFGANPRNMLKRKHLLLFAKAFMEKNDLDPQRLDQCCYAITGDKGVFSFCAYNNLHRFSHTNTRGTGT